MLRKFPPAFPSVFLVLLLLTALIAVPAVPPVQASDIGISLNGRVIATDVPPEVVNERVLVPMRAIFEAYGASVAWHSDTQSITAISGERSITLELNSTEAALNGTTIILDVSPFISNNRILVPMRFVAESLQAHVIFDAENQAVYSVGRIRSNEDIFNGHPDESLEFHGGEYQGSRDTAGNPSGQGIWIDSEGNNYTGSFSVGDGLTIENAVIDYGGSDNNESGGAPVAGGWTFTGKYWHNMDTGEEVFDGMDTFGDGTTFTGKYWYDSEGNLHEQGTLAWASGPVENLNAEGEEPGPTSKPVPTVKLSANPPDKTFELNAVTLSAVATGLEDPVFKFESQHTTWDWEDEWHTVQDWGPASTTVWNSGMYGSYNLKASARNKSAAEDTAVSNVIHYLVIKPGIPTGGVYFRVFDLGSGVVLAGASITLDPVFTPTTGETSYTETTDDAGTCTIRDLELGNYELTVSKSGFETYTEDMSVLTEGHIDEIVIVLHPLEEEEEI